VFIYRGEGKNIITRHFNLTDFKKIPIFLHTCCISKIEHHQTSDSKIIGEILANTPHNDLIFVEG
jgi:hypothetical protein